VNLGQYVSGVRAEGGIDASEDVVKGWANERLREMVARSKWRMAEINLGATVAGQARYVVADDVVDIEGLMVGSLPYVPVSRQKLWGIKYGDLSVTSGRGVFAPAPDSSGVEAIELYPVPDEAGIAIPALVALEPVTLANNSDEPDIPVDLHGYWRDGGLATGLALMDERLAESDRFEARFEQGVEMLSKRKISRFSHGPTQIQIAGVHF
jgi:hypothetical protein